MLLPLVLVRTLSQEEVGVFKKFFLYLFFIPGVLLSSGFVNGLAYWGGRGKEGREAIKVTSSVLFAGALLFALAIWLASAPLSSWLQWDSFWISLFALAVFATVAGSFFEEAAICTGRIWWGALFSAGFELLRTAAIVLAAIYFSSLSAVFAAHALFSFAKLLCGYILGFKFGFVGIAPSRETWAVVLRYALPVSLGGLFAILVIYADQLILSIWLSDRDFAFYAIGCLVIPPLFIIEQSVMRVAIPQMSEAFEEEDRGGAAFLYYNTVKQLALLFFPAVTGLFIFAKPIIELLFTTEYSASAGYLKLFAFTYLLLVFPYDAVPRARGEGGWILKNNLIFGCFSLVVCLSLLWFLGTYGALIGILISRSAMRGYGVWYAKKRNNWHFAEMLPLRALAKYGLVSVLLGLLAVTIRGAFVNDLWWLIYCAPLFPLFYFLTLIVWKDPVSVSAKAPLRLVLLTQYLRIGGLERMVLGLAYGLSEGKRWDPSVFYYDGIDGARGLGLQSEFEKRGIRVDSMQKGRGVSPRVVLRLGLLLCREDVNLLHTHDLGALIYGVLVKLFSPRKIYLVHTQHSFVHLARHKRYSLYEKIFTRFVDELVVVSGASKSRYQQLGVPSERISVIENGVDFAAAKSIPRDRSRTRLDAIGELGDGQRGEVLRQYLDEYWFLSLARIHPVKGQRHLIRLWSHLPENIRERAALLLVGPDELAEEVAALRRMINEAPASERIFLLGGTHNPSSWLVAADVYLSLSEFEGLPLGPLEAIGSATPALLSTIEGHKFLESWSEQCAYENPEEGAVKLEQMIERLEREDPAWQEVLQSNAAAVRAKYSSAQMVSKYSALYERVCGLAARRKPRAPFCR